MKQKLFILLLLSAFGGRIIAQNPDFWDGIEAFDGPTDENPILAAQIDFYFDRLVSPLPDSITMEISRLVKRTEHRPDLRDFILWKLLDKYQCPEYMTQDQVFVWLYDHYFSQMAIKDLNDANLALIREKAERLRHLALYQPAPNFQLSESIDLQSIESKYTVLFFYDHDCDLCQQEMRDLDSVFLSNPDVLTLAIDMNPDATVNGSSPSELIGLYDIETTPLIYVLDRDKRIMAKKIRARQIPLIL
ncbi:MAG: redoxin domain-containing protein [Bacteroidales bacterium]|nr:redoxin domain-containing protein [Bacteroidales bacterium]